jgi:DNA-binding transcriptional regulator YdaS (Cro superfamily)
MNTTPLRTYFYGLSPNERGDFALRCGTSPEYIIQIINKNRNCSAPLAINIDRESGGEVSCDELCPSADFAYLRSSKQLTTIV